MISKATKKWIELIKADVKLFQDILPELKIKKFLLEIELVRV